MKEFLITVNVRCQLLPRLTGASFDMLTSEKDEITTESGNMCLEGAVRAVAHSVAGEAFRATTSSIRDKVISFIAQLFIPSMVNC